MDAYIQSGKIASKIRDEASEMIKEGTLVIDLVKIIGHKEFSISQLMELSGLKHRPNFIEYHLNPAISEGYIRRLYPDSPRHQRQKYLLTIKGQSLYNELTKQK